MEDERSIASGQALIEFKERLPMPNSSGAFPRLFQKGGEKSGSMDESCW